MPVVQVTSGRPFRGSSALVSGALTRSVLYGPGYRRLYPDIHISANAELDLETWSRAAHELVSPCGVLAGYSAAELHGADHRRPDRALRDLEREQLLVAAGWRIIRFDAVTVLHYPRTIAARVRQELCSRGVRA